MEALEHVQPEDVQPSAIEPRLGAVWIPARDVEGFVHEVLELKDCQVALHGRGWCLVGDLPASGEARQNVKVTQEWGTLANERDRAGAVRALNVQVPTVRDRHPLTEDRYVVNPGGNAGSAREARGADQGPLRRPGPSRKTSAASGCAGSTTTCSTPRGRGISMART